MELLVTLMQSSKAIDDTSIRIDGLKSNTEYTFQVSAKNAAGNGPFASKSQRTAQIGKVAYNDQVKSWFKAVFHCTSI
jgi:hypothetical protein